jgi:hypothetical protein
MTIKRKGEKTSYNISTEWVIQTFGCHRRDVTKRIKSARHLHLICLLFFVVVVRSTIICATVSNPFRRGKKMPNVDISFFLFCYLSYSSIDYYYSTVH